MTSICPIRRVRFIRAESRVVRHTLHVNLHETYERAGGRTDALDIHVRSRQSSEPCFVLSTVEEGEEEKKERSCLIGERSAERKIHEELGAVCDLAGALERKNTNRFA